MFFRSCLLFLCTFLFVFGWKITDALDIILIVSAGLAVWAFVFFRESLSELDVKILMALLLLSVYSTSIVVFFGAADTQVSLRAIRAMINYIGAAALVRLFVIYFRATAASIICVYLYGAIAVHAVVICLMFFSPALRSAIYNLTSAFNYVNQNAPILLGLRIPGLTYGLASTSVVQMMGLVLLPVALKAKDDHLVSRIGLWLAALPIVVSLFLTGRTGLLFAVFAVPAAFIIAGRLGRSASAGNAVTRVLIAASMVAVLAAVVASDKFGVMERFSYNLSRATEVLDFFSERGSTDTTQRLGAMYFLPNEVGTLLFGSSNLGRGALGYIESDVGYVKLVFSIGLLGLTLTMLPYLMGLGACIRNWRDSIARDVVFVTIICLVVGMVLNLKELSLLTRNQWSIQALLIGACMIRRRDHAIHANFIRDA